MGSLRNVRYVVSAYDFDDWLGSATGGSGVLLAVMSIIAAVVLVLVRVMPPIKIGG